jgi:hypothetical protein
MKEHVANLCFKCFRCFIGMLQVFHMDIAKVDQDVAYVAMVIHICCKLMFSMFYLFFRRMLQVCLFGCYICFTHMLQVFYLDLTYVLQWFQVFFRCFCKRFRCIFQVFYLSSTNVASVASLDVSKVDRVLHFSHRLLLPRLGVSSSRCWLGI